MNKVIRFLQFSFLSASQSLIGSMILIVIMTLSVIAFNRAIGYIRYQNNISSAFIKSDLENAIYLSSGFKYTMDMRDNDNFLKDNDKIMDIEGVEGIGYKVHVNFRMELDERLWEDHDGVTRKDMISHVDILTMPMANSCYIPLKKVRQLFEADDLPDDVYPILITDKDLKYFPLGVTKKIKLGPSSYAIEKAGGPDSDAGKWNPEVKVQTVGIIRENAAIIDTASGIGGYNNATISTVSRIINTIDDNGGQIFMPMPMIYEKEINNYCDIFIKHRIIQLMHGYDPSEISKDLMELGDFGATPFYGLLAKMRENYKNDIFRYTFDFVIFALISIVAVGGFNALIQRWQRRYLSVLYMCGASWRRCVISDILRGVFVVAVPGMIAILVEWFRTKINFGGIWHMTIFNFLVNTLKIDEGAAVDMLNKISLSTGEIDIGLTDEGIMIDNYTFLFSFLLIVVIYIFSSAWFHFSMMKTKPADEIRNWQ